MTRLTNPITGPASAGALAGLALTLTLVLLPAPSLRAGASGASGTIRYTGHDFEGRQSFQYEWTALSNATYLVQSATDLTSPDAWQTVDAVTPTNDAGQYEIKGRSIPENSAEFFRLVLPQPRILSVEPAIVTPGVAVDLYVLGQCFDTNLVLQINGVTQSNAIVQTSTTMADPSFTPDLPGSYQFSLVSGGTVVSSFTVTCADALANPELVLQGPPTEPPASPSKKEFKGHVTLLKAFDDGSEDNQEGKKDFKGHVTLLKAFDDEGDNTAARGHTKSGHVTLLKRSDDGSSARHTKSGHVTLLKAFDDGADDLEAKKDFKGHVTLLKAFDDGSDNATARGVASVIVKPPPHCPAVVSPFSGEVQESVVDMLIPGRGLDFVWARTYHSRIGRFGSAANGWTFSYDLNLQPRGGDIVIHNGTGRADTFKPDANGVYTCPEFFSEGAFTGGVFRLTFADTGYWEFNPLDGTATAGKLAHIVDRNGNTLSLGYDGSGLLTQVVDDLGRTNTVAYDLAGRVTSVTDFSGRVVRYEYDGNGDLVSCVSPAVTGTPDGNDFPGGKTNRYTYSTGYLNDAENHLLLTVTDPKGQPACQFTYEHNSGDPNYLRCGLIGLGKNPIERITILPQIATPANHFAVARCIINDPLGNVVECFYDARNRCVIERDYTGRATPGVPVTDTLNRPTGKLRSSDPDYYETQWTWNNDSLCTSETAPGGQQVRCVYQSDFDASTPARKRADCRVVRELAASPVDLDGDGVADASDRTWRYEYDPRFGSDPGSMTASPAEGTVRWHPAAGGLEALSAIGINEKLPYATLHANMRQRVLDIENVLKNLGLLTRTSGGKRFGIGVSSPASPLGRKSGDTATGGAGGAGGAGGGNGGLASAEYTYPELHSHSHDPCTGAAFVTSVTDPRGNVTADTYDASGNRVKVQFHWDRQGSAERDFAYDPHGQLTAVTNAPDANGRSRVDTFSWSQGQVTQCVMDVGGLALTSAFEYDVHGNLARYVDPRTNDWLYTCNALDQCVRAQSPPNITSRCTTDFSYDANDNLAQVSTEVRDAADNLAGGQTNRFQYDELDRLTEMALAVDASRAQTNRFVYDDDNQCVQVLGPDAVSGADPNQSVTFEYDERGLLLRRTQAPGTPLSSSDEFDYNAIGDLSVMRDRLCCGGGNGGGASGGAINFIRDGFDRCASVIDEMGNVITLNSDANDNLKVIRSYGELNDVAGSAGNIRLAESRYEYDGLDRCVVQHDLHFNPATQAPVGDGEATTTFAYAPDSQCTSVTDDLGHATAFGYDTAGRPASITSPDGKTVVVSVRDAFGNVTRSTETDTPDLGGPPQVLSVTNVYDALNRCISTTDGAGNTGSCAYDSLDRVVRTTDASGNDTTCAYDLLDNCVASTDYAGSSSLLPATIIHSAQATYDLNSRCLTTIDANGNTNGYAYDSLGRCTTVTQADGTQEQLVWSPRSNLIQETDPNGTVITNTYDLNDRIIHRDLATRFEAFTYDGCDRLTGETDNDCDGAFAYDSLDNCVSETLNGLATTSTYDAAGNRLSLTYPGGRSLVYAYDSNDRCTSITDSSTVLASFSYDGPARLSSETCGNGVTSYFTYDGLTGTPNTPGDHGFGQVTHIQHVLTAGSQEFSDVKFSWDLKQNKTARTVAIPGAGGTTNVMGFAYDPIDRLVETLVMQGSSVLRDTTYGLDRMGNRTNVTGAAACSGDYAMDATWPIPADFQMNQYTATPCDTRNYDDNGNLVARSSPTTGPVTYQYDYADRLVQVQSVDFSSGLPAITTSTYAYDALGRRISKSVSSGGLPPVTTQFLYDGGSVIEERSGGVVEASFVLDATRSIDDGVIQTRRAGQDYYLHTDDQGNALALTDASGNVVERYDYDDYGAVAFLAADGTPLVDGGGLPVTSSPAGNVYCWGGLRLDAETGLHNNDGGDYLEPQTGRAVRGKVKSIKDMGNGVFSAKTRDTLDDKFKDGDIPTQDQFGTLIDSMVNKLDDRDLIGLRVFGTGDNNPWSGGGGGGGGGGGEMQKGTVKFFNEAKGFGMVVGGVSKTHTKTGHVTLMK